MAIKHLRVCVWVCVSACVQRTCVCVCVSIYLHTLYLYTVYVCVDVSHANIIVFACWCTFACMRANACVCLYCRPGGWVPTDCIYRKRISTEGVQNGYILHRRFTVDPARVSSRSRSIEEHIGRSRECMWVHRLWCLHAALDKPLFVWVYIWTQYIGWG